MIYVNKTIRRVRKYVFEENLNGGNDEKKAWKITQRNCLFINNFFAKHCLSCHDDV